MGKKTSRRLVVDASVAHAAGTTQHPVSKACRESLMEIMRICHKIVMTDTLRDEWRHHRSNFAQGWLAAMVSKRKVVEVVADEASPSFTSVLDDGAFSEKDLASISKDLHLVLAALQTDRTVVSRDDNARRLFQSLAAQVPSLGTVAWVNPSNSEETAIEWLKAGARNEVSRRLRHLPDDLSG